MKLIGIEIQVGERKKFIGKVGTVPVGALPMLAGNIIFYREAPFDLAYSYETESIGFDVAATDKAAELGAVYVVSYHTDKSSRSVATMADLQNAPMVDLGERLQYRLPIKKWVHHTGGKINMGYTRNVVLVKAKRKLPKTGEELRNEGLQKSLFDFGMGAGSTGDAYSQ